MNTFYGKISNKGDALAIVPSCYHFITQGLLIGGIGAATPIPFFLCKYTTIQLLGQEATCNFKTIVV
jgi:hypothetical protein